MIIDYLIASRQRRRAINPSPRPSLFTHGVKVCSKYDRLGAVTEPIKMNIRLNCARNKWQKAVNDGSGSGFYAFACDNLVTILAGNRPILTDTGALASGCKSLIMLVVVAKYELALNGSTGLRTKRSHVRVVPGASSFSII